MIEAWVLMVFMASGEVALFQTSTELVCDTERTAIARHVAEDVDCPVAVAAQCVPALLQKEVME